MGENELPKLDMGTSDTGCCPKFNAVSWDQRTFVFKNKLFVRAKVWNFMHMPINLGAVLKRTFKTIREAGAETDDFILLSTDTSPWRGVHYFAVSKEVPGADNVKLSGTYEAKVFEGPYKNMRQWIEQLNNYISGKDQRMKQMYFYYTTCPKCAEFYDKNYVVGFAQVA
ncbi:MAG: hydrolase [Candidatus Saccharimonadales bacterium]|nr:hydrolase [Candidatus Saccharimonadales bacterium]